MTVNRKVTGTASTIPEGLTAGVLTSVASMLAGLLACAYMIDSELLEWNKAGYAVMCVLILSSWLGAGVASRKIKRRRLLVCSANGALYFVLLLILTGLFFGGKYSGVLEGGLLILCGSMLGVLLGMPAGKGRSRRNIRSRTG